MKNFYRSIILFVVAFVAVVGFAPQTKALDVDDGNSISIFCRSDSDCAMFEQCIAARCVALPTACMTSRDCDDGVFCNGAEICDKTFICIAGTAPCAGEICVEADDACIECEVDGDCADGVCTAGNICVECEADVDCADGEICEEELCAEACPELPLEVRGFDKDGNCLFSKDELKDAKTFYKEEHKGQKNDLKESQAEDKELLKSMKEYAE